MGALAELSAHKFLDVHEDPYGEPMDVPRVGLLNRDDFGS
jgi:hypothetical protein